MSHLTDTQRAELRAELERELAKLERSMSVTEEALKPVELDQAAVGRLSRMDSLMSQGIAQGLHEREVVRLGLIQEALRRLDAGTYGSCSACGADVAYERLFVFPESVTCALCAA